MVVLPILPPQPSPPSDPCQVQLGKPTFSCKPGGARVYLVQLSIPIFLHVSVLERRLRGAFEEGGRLDTES